MNHYYEQYCQIAKDFGLDRKAYYLCTLPGIHPSDCIMKYDGQKHRIYCADHFPYHNGYDLGQLFCYAEQQRRSDRGNDLQRIAQRGGIFDITAAHPHFQKLTEN